MNYRIVSILAIIGLLMSTGVVSAWGGLSIYRVDWMNPHSKSPGQSIMAYVNNDNGQPITTTITLQLSVPGWYTRNFQRQYTVPGFAKQQPIPIGFILRPEWPTGNYNAQLTMSGAANGMGGTIRVN